MKEQIRKILTVDRGVVYGDFPGLIADLETLINQEVEKRIAERMPSEEEVVDEDWRRECKGEPDEFTDGAEWFRSRLTKRE